MPHPFIAYLMFLANIDELAQVFGEEEIQRPVESDAQLLFQPGQLTQINCEPQGEKPRNIHAEDACHAGAVRVLSSSSAAYNPAKPPPAMTILCF